MKDIKTIIGERIKSERLKRKMSAEELASYLNVSTSFIGLIERGKRGTNIKLLSEISRIFQVSIDDMISDVKLAMGENKDDEYDSALAALNTLARTLDVTELNFVIGTIRNLHKMKVGNLSESEEPKELQEQYY